MIGRRGDGKEEYCMLCEKLFQYYQCERVGRHSGPLRVQRASDDSDAARYRKFRCENQRHHV